MNDPKDETNNLKREIRETRKELADLKRHHEQMLGPVNPNFDAFAFRRVFMTFIPLFVIVFLLTEAIMFTAPKLSNLEIGGIPLVKVASDGDAALGLIAVGGLAFGLVAFGGLSIGVFAFGGLSIGLVAFGGGALGLIAVGGGSVGLIALGGGAAGYVAIGGGAAGKYILAGGGVGKHVLSYQRHDYIAAKFFCRYLKRLQLAFPNGIEALETNRY